jgi:diguanylate cyclase (GGDEF)-like protein/PAS domain S-box-containing protein
MTVARLLLLDDTPHAAHIATSLGIAAEGAFQVVPVSTVVGACRLLADGGLAAAVLHLSGALGEAVEQIRTCAPEVPLIGLVSTTSGITALGTSCAATVQADADGPTMLRAVRAAIARGDGPAGDAFSAALLHGVGQSVIAADLTGMITYWNGYAEQDYGWRADEAIGRPLLEMTTPPALRERGANALRLVLDAGRLEGEFAGLRRNGEQFAVAAVLSRIDGPDGAPVAIVAVSSDISDRLRAEAELRDSEQFYRALYEQARHPVLVLDQQLQIVAANPAACAFYGLTIAEMRTLALRDITLGPELEDDAARLRALGANDVAFTEERTHIKRNGDVATVALNAVAIAWRDALRYVLTVIDLSDRKRTEAALEHRALHDPLTGLPNRTLFDDRLAQAIRQGNRDATPLALLLMDVDRFREINDTFGHHYGDVLLLQLGERLRDLLRESDTIGRLGGDEFAMVLPQCDEAGAVTTAQRVLAALDEPFFLEGQYLAVSASVGIATFPAHGLDAHTLLRRADIAMYIAKRGGGGHAVYSAQLDQHSPQRLALIGEMRQAIEAGQFVLHYQPLVGLQSGDANRVEALVRWQHPQRGFIPPDQFIPLAEQTGLIEPLTRWVLDAALAQCRRWREAGVALSVAVNLSTRTLHDPNLPEVISALLRKHGIAPEQLRLEVTESVIMYDPERVLGVLARLTRMGVRFSIDDFGTGYSSLGYLRRLPVDELKIDKSFVLEMTADENDALIVRSTIDLAHNLGLRVVAEGIENLETYTRLAQLGCDMAQGFYLARPMPAAALEVWLQQPLPAAVA